MSKIKVSTRIPSARATAPTQEPSEDAVRDYAYHLYLQGRCEPGHDVDNWLEATACLKANIPTHSSHSRLHQHVNGPGHAPRETATV
ncbi:MAG: DUF2934 domain-containing protein [Opitutus sp.]